MMAWKVLGRIRSAVNHHIYHLDRCGDTIEKYGLHFFNGKALKQWKDCVVSRSVFHMWLPALLTLIFGIRASIYILWPHWFDTRAKRLAIFSEILFENSRRNLEVTIMVWSFMHVLYITYVIRGRMVHFALLAILKVNPMSMIKPGDLGLKAHEYQHIAKFRRLAFIISDCICHGISIGAGMVVTTQIYLGSLLQLNAYHALFWLAYLQICAFYFCTAAYALPIFICIIAFYLQVKQTSMLNSMNRLNGKLHKYLGHIMENKKSFEGKSQKLSYVRCIRVQLMAVHRRNASVRHELHHYGHVVARCLNIIFLVYITVICYITYILFFTQNTIDFQIFYWQIYLAHITVLTVLIMRCSAITRFNPCLRLLMVKLYIKLAKQRLFSARDLLKFDNLMQLISRRSGFTLANGFRIDTNAYLAVIYAISVFFVLIVKQRKYFL